MRLEIPSCTGRLVAEFEGVVVLVRELPSRPPRGADCRGRFCREVDVSLEEAQAVLAALALMGGERNPTQRSRLRSV